MRDRARMYDDVISIDASRAAVWPQDFGRDPPDLHQCCSFLDSVSYRLRNVPIFLQKVPVTNFKSRIFVLLENRDFYFQAFLNSAARIARRTQTVQTCANTEYQRY